MAQEKSTFVCARCGLGIHHLDGAIWKHLAGGRTGKTCGSPPAVVRRDLHEKALKDAFSALANRIALK